jgi:hypothetical protein
MLSHKQNLKSAGGMVQVVERLPNMHRRWVQSLAPQNKYTIHFKNDAL